MRSLLRLLLFASTLVSFALAGCAEGGDEAPPVASVSPSTSAAPAPPPPPAILVGTCQTTSGLSYGVTGLTYNSMEPGVCPFSSAAPGDLGRMQSGLLEVVWTPASAAVTGAGLLVESDQCRSRTTVDASGLQQEQCNWGLTNGQSPLKFEVARAVFEAAGRDNLTVYLLPEGASTSQPFTVYVSLFEGAMPAGYTAIP